MLDVVLAILPVFALIFLGTGLKAAGFLPPAFWEGAERLTYFLLFPALLLTTLAKAEFGDLEVLPMAAAIAAAVLLMAASLLAAKQQALQNVRMKDVDVQTPLATAACRKIDTDIVVVPILRQRAG